MVGPIRSPQLQPVWSQPLAAPQRAPPGASGPPRSRSTTQQSAALRVAPELSDPVGALEVGQLQDVEQLGTGSGAERVEARPQPTLDLTGTHGWRLRGRTVASVSGDWLIKTIRMGSPQHQSLMLQRAA